MDTEENRKWYVAKTGTHQGLIIDEKTGISVAVSYDKEDAPLIAVAPELLAMIELVEALAERPTMVHWDKVRLDCIALIIKARKAT